MHRRRIRPACVFATFLAAALSLTPGAWAQLQSGVSVRKTNARLAGRVIDLTHNHGSDNRFESKILGMPRDVYVYLPPGYTPANRYPLLLYFHGAFGDEHAFLEKGRLEVIDRMICQGQFPPCIVACPDGTFSGRNTLVTPLSLYINSPEGCVEDYVLKELVPFLETYFSIRPERTARAIMGISSGAFGAVSIAIRHRDRFGAVASLAGAINLRYADCTGEPMHDFRPERYRWKTEYRPHETFGAYLGGLVKIPQSALVKPVFGSGAGVIPQIARLNPADLLFTSGMQPGELAIYIDYGGRDNFNFDAHAESFAWLAASRQIAVTLVRDPDKDHSLAYFRASEERSWRWLAYQLDWPTPAVNAGPSSH